jgi:hypothetical protein
VDGALSAASLIGKNLVVTAGPSTAAVALTANKLNLCQNSSANASALFTLPTAAAGAWLDIHINAYSTVGTDSIKIKTNSTAISVGANSSIDVLVFGAVSQYVRLVGASATNWVIMSLSTGVSLAATT